MAIVVVILGIIRIRHLIEILILPRSSLKGFAALLAAQNLLFLLLCPQLGIRWRVVVVLDKSLLERRESSLAFVTAFVVADLGMDFRLVSLVLKQGWALYFPVSWDTGRCHIINKLSGGTVPVLSIKELKVRAMLLI